MVFDPKIYHNSKDGIGDPGDVRAASADEASTLVSLSKALLYAFNVTGISVTFAGANKGPGTSTDALRTVAASNSPDTVSLASIDTKLTTLNFNTDTLETALGVLVETAPASDTASSGLNGRLQRVAQRLAAGAANIGKAEDAASADGDVGVPAMAVVKAAPADTVGTDGDYQSLQMKSGRLWVDPSGVTLTVAAHAVTQSGTWTVQPGNTANTTAWKVDGSAFIQPVSGTVAATQSGTWNVTVNAALPAGTALLGKVGIDQTTAGTTNAVSVAQIGATVVASGNGVVGAGVQRVAIASDNTAFSVNAVQSGSWSLAANQSVNAAQINGVTPLMGNGGTGTGSQRVTIASDNTAFSVNAVQSGTWNIGTVSTVTAVTAITNALPAGANAIGKLAANSGVIIGAVEIAAGQTVATVTNVATIGTSVTPGTGAAHLGKAEDAAHASGDTGVMALAVRNNTASALAGTDGDYLPLTTDTVGALWVNNTKAATDGSTTITAGATAQNLFGGTTPVNGFSIFNPDATEYLWISDSTTAAANATGSIGIPPLGYYATEPGQKPIQAVSAVAATTGHKLTARRW